MFKMFKKLKNPFTQICNMARFFRAKNYYIYICKVFLFKDNQACEEPSLLKIGKTKIE